MNANTFKQKLFLIIFGLFLCVFILEIGLRMGGAIILALREQTNKVSSFKLNNEYRIMCLGESTTACCGDKSYPRQLEKILNKKKLGIRFKVINKGVEGVDSGMILSKLEENIHKYNPDLIIAMMGANDGMGFIAYDDSPVMDKKLFSGQLENNLDSRDIDTTIKNSVSNSYILDKATSLFPSEFKIYKLLKLLRLHILSKIREIKDYSLKNKIVVTGNGKESAEYFQNEMLNFFVLKTQGEYEKAEEIIREIIKKYPDSEEGYIQLGDCCVMRGKFEEAEKALKKAIDINSKSSEAFAILGWCYTQQKKFSEAELALKKAIDINPISMRSYSELFSCYFKQGPEKLKEIDSLVKKIADSDCPNDSLYGFIATSYREQGRYQEAEEYYRKANEFRAQYYNPTTRHSYQKLRRIAVQKEIKLVCVQYPMRSIEPLKKLFDSTNGLIFVDNEKIFKDAVKQAKYEDYFTDNFGGDFGHCTPRGNRLLAENVAKAITKEVFNK